MSIQVLVFTVFKKEHSIKLPKIIYLILNLKFTKIIQHCINYYCQSMAKAGVEKFLGFGSIAIHFKNAEIEEELKSCILIINKK